MKRKCMVVLALILMLSLLAACGGSNSANSTSGNNDPQKINNGGDTKTSDDSKSNDDSKNGGDSSSDEKFEYGEDYILNNLKGDYSITYKLSSTGEDDSSVTIKSVRTSDGYYLSSDGTEMLFIKDGDKYYMYQGSSESEFTKVDFMEFTQSDVETYFSAINGYMMMYSAYSSGMEKDGTETVAGRNCDKYSVSYTGFGVAMQYSASIDKETGVCLKWIYAAAAGGEAGGATYECTEFKTSGVSLPAYQ